MYWQVINVVLLLLMCTLSRSIGTSDKQWLHPKRLLVAFLMFSRLLIFLAIVCASQPFRLQGVAVKGRLWCGEVLLRNTKVKIYDIDTSEQWSLMINKNNF